jgi:hypothetical protein
MMLEETPLLLDVAFSSSAILSMSKEHEDGPIVHHRWDDRDGCICHYQRHYAQ